MAEQRSSRQGESKGPRPPSESHLRLVGADGQVVFDDAASETDDSPTIISKNARPAEPASVSSDGSSIRGRKLAHFELIEPIGVGGMAAVLRARDTQLDRIVALKILPPPMAKDPENIRRFHQEARAAAKLDHENIARVFFCGEDQGLHFIAFEYVEGENLRVILERRGRLPVGEAIRCILQIATGLEHAASRSVVHRDVKPSNIIITPTGRAKLVDMGLARSLEPHDDAGLTQSGVTLGTFDYISPEQALEPRDADSRSDLYSLGCTFYHMLTGQAPVPEGTAARKLHHHQHVAPTDPRQINPDIPDDVAFIVGKLMAKNPRERFQRPVLLVQHLLQIAEKYGATHDLPEPLFVDVNVPTDPVHRPLVLVSLAALLLAGLLFLLSLSSSEPKHSTEPPTPPTPVETTANVTPTPVQPPASRLVDIIRNEAELAAALEKATPGQPLTLTLENPKDRPSFELTGGLTIGETKASRIDVVAARPLGVRLAFAPTPGVKKEQFGLRIACKQPVTFKWIAFDVGPKRDGRDQSHAGRRRRRGAVGEGRVLPLPILAGPGAADDPLHPGPAAGDADRIDRLRGEREELAGFAGGHRQGESLLDGAGRRGDRRARHRLRDGHRLRFRRRRHAFPFPRRPTLAEGRPLLGVSPQRPGLPRGRRRVAKAARGQLPLLDAADRGSGKRTDGRAEPHSPARRERRSEPYPLPWLGATATRTSKNLSVVQPNRSPTPNFWTRIAAARIAESMRDGWNRAGIRQQLGVPRRRHAADFRGRRRSDQRGRTAG